MRKESTKPLSCPKCGVEAKRSDTQYGRRDACEACGLHSWHGKPLVSEAVHDARKHCHEIFDRLWKEAHRHYEIAEPIGSDARHIAEVRIDKTARARAYRFIAFTTGLPEKDCHMADQTDLEKLRTIYKAARDTTDVQVRDWWKSEGEVWWAEQVRIEKLKKDIRREEGRKQRAKSAKDAA